MFDVKDIKPALVKTYRHYSPCMNMQESYLQGLYGFTKRQHVHALNINLFYVLARFSITHKFDLNYLMLQIDRIKHNFRSFFGYYSPISASVSVDVCDASETLKWTKAILNLLPLIESSANLTNCSTRRCSVETEYFARIPSSY